MVVLFVCTSIFFSFECGGGVEKRSEKGGMSYSVVASREEAHTDGVWSVCWSKKLNVIVTGSVDGTVKMWWGGCFSLSLSWSACLSPSSLSLSLDVSSLSLCALSLALTLDVLSLSRSCS